jgi:hypothetical protein
MSKKGTKLERNLKSGSKRRKRQPIGMPLKRIAKGLAYAAAIANKRKHRDGGE